MIVFTDIAAFSKIKEKYNFISVDIVPIEIKNNLFILNEESEANPIFKGFFSEFFDKVNYERRAINKNEFITFDILNR